MMLEVAPLEQIDIAAEAGFDAVGLCVNPRDRLGASLVRDAALRRQVRDHLKHRGVTVLDIEVFPLTPEIDIAEFMPALETGAELGAKFVLVTGNDTDDARACDKFARLCDLAVPLGLRPMLEFISYRPLRDIKQADHWLRRANRPEGGMCVDALHLFRSGGTLADLLQIAPRDIGYAQLCDAAYMQPAQFFSEEQLVRESRTDRRLPGEGILPLVEFLDALPPDLAISVEAPCEAYAHLPPQERAVLAMTTSRAVLAKARPR